MPDQSVLRKESKRWVAPKTSYDGDDWGNDEYDEYEYPGFAEEDEIEEEEEDEPQQPQPQHPTPASTVAKASAPEPAPVPAPVPERAPAPEPVPEPAPEPTETSFARAETSAQDTPAEIPPEADSTKSSKYSSQDTSKDLVMNQDNDEEYDNSIQDIYGFYENRYSVHPYNAILSGSTHSMTPNEYSDSSASLSTGRHSLEWERRGSDLRSGSELRGSTTDYQSDLHKVPEVSREVESRPLGENLPRIDHLNIRKGHSRDTSLESNAATPSVAAGHTDFSSPERPYSQVVDADIAELYQGSSDFLNRPISTYNPLPQRDISDQSIKDLLTPRLQQDDFDNEAQQQQEEISEKDRYAVPPLFITSASPDALGASASTELEPEAEANAEAEHEHEHEPEPESSAKAEAKTESQLFEAKTEPSTKPETKPETASEKIRSFEQDHDYVDQPGDHDLDEEASDDADSDLNSVIHRQTTNASENPASPLVDSKPSPLEDSAPFILPSERNRLNAAPESPISPTIESSPKGGDRHVDWLGSGLPSEQQASEHQSDKFSDKFASEQQSDKFSERPSESLSEDYIDKHSESTSENAAHRHSYRSSASGKSDATGVTSFSAQSETAEDSRETDPTQIPSDRSPNLSSSQATAPSPQSTDINAQIQAKNAAQPIAAKVKRPPQVDFSALLNKSGTSSESRCEQMRILRMREAEYSSGLETWLMTTMTQVDKSMKIYTNGIPPAGEANALELPTTAKVSNAMHSSATNTKEKLGKVGEKSKSFFAKVIR